MIHWLSADLFSGGDGAVCVSLKNLFYLVSQQDISKRYWQIWTKFLWKIDLQPRTNRLGFRTGLDPGLDTGWIFSFLKAMEIETGGDSICFRHWIGLLGKLWMALEILWGIDLRTRNIRLDLETDPLLNHGWFRIILQFPPLRYGAF